MPHVDVVRRFNRFYTGRIGVLPEHYLGSSYSLAEARLVYEVGRRRQCTATELGRELALDLGYLSRLLRGSRTGACSRQKLRGRTPAAACSR